MMRYLAVGTVLFLALAFTIERRAAEACSSFCGEGGNHPCASSCTCWGTSSVAIDATYSNIAACKARIVAIWSCSASNIQAKLTNCANSEPVSICSGGACTGTSWTANGDVTPCGGGCPGGFNAAIQLINDCGNCDPDTQGTIQLRWANVICE